MLFIILQHMLGLVLRPGDVATTMMSDSENTIIKGRCTYDMVSEYMMSFL